MLRALLALSTFAFAASAAAQTIPRAANGKPDLQGIWQVHNRAAYGLEYHDAKHLMPAGPSVVDGGEIPYLPAARAQQQQNFTNRAAADPLNNCYLPGVPRIMYMEHPFQIFQTAEHLAITFEWSQVYRLIYTAGQPTLHAGVESWMGNSRGRWEGDVLVVEVTDHNDRTWLDAAGTFHSSALRVTERYSMRNADTIDYEATIEDPNVFARPWTIRVPLHRQTDLPRLYEYQCQAEKEEANGAFERDARTWYPAPIPAENARFDARASANLPPPAVTGRSAGCPMANPTCQVGSSSTPAAATMVSSRARRYFSRRQAAASSSIRPTAACRIRRGRAPSGSRAHCRTAATTTQRRIVSSPAFRARITCHNPCKSFNRRVTSSSCSSAWRGGTSH